MNKWLTFSVIFLSSYLVFLLATTPLSMVVNNIPPPQDIVLKGVTGSIWEGEIEQVIVNDMLIEEVKTNLSFWSLFTLSPSVELVFGNAISKGVEGRLLVSISSEKIILSDVDIYISANDVIKQLPLPIPLKAKGSVELSLAELVLMTHDDILCAKADGHLSWSGASINALDKNIKLGKFSANISCNDGNIHTDILPKNNLGLSFNSVLTIATQSISGKGYLKPTSKFPNQLKPSLSFLGQPDNQGRYALRI